MPKASDILGMNARNQQYVSLTSKFSKSLADSKIATNYLMESKDIPTPVIHGMLVTPEDVNAFDWSGLQDNFVIKPTNGLAGSGVIVFRKRVPGQEKWHDALGKIWSLDDIKLHCFDILEGQYSKFGSLHTVIIQERVPIHSSLLKYVFKGTPDVRVIVFNHVPVMAMVRLPTEKSEGRANLHQGAIACGIDIASGVTTGAISGKGKPLVYMPGTKTKLRGIKIPFWKAILTTAVDAAAAAQMPYCGVDIFVHQERGPLVVELNAQPGLSIQLANRAGLRRRLERVQDLNVLNTAHGVKIGQALFAASFSDKIIAEEGLQVVSPHEDLIVFGEGKEKDTLKALLNTGRFRSAISEDTAAQLHLIDPDDLLWYQQEKKEGLAPVVEVKFKLKNRMIKTAMVVSKRLNKGSYRIELGRKDLEGFLVGSNQ